MLLYPSSASPRTRATSIDRMATSPSTGTCATSASRRRSLRSSRTRRMPSNNGLARGASDITLTSVAESTDTAPAIPLRAAASLMRASPGNRSAPPPRIVPTKVTRSATRHSGRASNTVIASNALGSPSDSRLPLSSTSTTSRTNPTNRVGFTRCRARRSTANPRSMNPVATVASIRTNCPSGGSRITGVRADSTVSESRSVTPSVNALPARTTSGRIDRTAPCAPRRRDHANRQAPSARTTLAIAHGATAHPRTSPIRPPTTA